MTGDISLFGYLIIRIFDYFCDWRYLTAVAQFSERLGLAEAGDSAGPGEARTVRSPVGPQPGPTGLCCC